jgi:hypothetical protein
LLRELTFGSQLSSYAECPRCGEKLEFEYPVRSLLSSSPAAEPEGQTGATGSPMGIRDTQVVYEVQTDCVTQTPETGSYMVHFRLPDSFDLAAISGSRDADDARRLLLERCVMDVTRTGDAVDTDARRASGEAQSPIRETHNSIAISDIPGEIIAQLAEQIGRADPDADISLDLSCPACEHRWQIAFDIVTFFWAEINSLAKRLLREVHTLARAYGWREADILAMSAARRQAYLEMVL